MPQLIAMKAFRYGARSRKANDVFHASRSDARVLVAIGRASYLTAVSEPEITKAESDVHEQMAGDENPAVSEPEITKAESDVHEQMAGDENPAVSEPEITKARKRKSKNQ